MTQLNNYFGCRVWNADSCIECSQGYYFNNHGVCCQVDQYCLQFNLAQGICEQCYEGYSVVNGKCQTVNATSAANIGCALWNNGVCQTCSKRWYFNADKVCVAVSDLCSTWDEVSGACLTCYYGSVVQNGNCVANTDTSVVPDSNLLCKIWSGVKCLECADRAFFNSNGLCIAVSSQCSTFDKASGKCLTCYGGYDLQNGQCVYSTANTATPSDLGCGTWDWKNQVCLACSNRWAFNANKVCVPVSDQCATSGTNGNCLTCYQGYDLSNGKCLFLSSNNTKPVDAGCGTWDWKNQVCLACSSQWVFNADKKCVAVSDQCKTHAANGDCTACFQGYDLSNGTCVFSASNNAKPSDLGCGTWDWNNQVCLVCSTQWFKNSNGNCVPVSDQCATNAANGDCTSCFKGYDLSAGLCILSASNNAKPVDLGCGSWDWNNQVCLTCANKWVFNANKKCAPVSDQCAANAANGDCTICYKGYDLINGTCLYSASNTGTPADLGCGTWDWKNQVCLACSKSWVLNAQKVCAPVSDQCKTFANNGDCTACFLGYDLTNGKCVYSASNTAAPVDLGCGTWDWRNQVCLACSSHWVFNSKNVCLPVSDQCKTNTASGDCTACYQGYDLQNGKCVFSNFNNAKPADLGCGTWDWNGQVCLACSSKWVFNANKKCVAVSDLCATNADNGDCLTCFKGYDLQNGKCVFSSFNNAKPADLGCGTWDWNNQVCLACSNLWVFNAEGKCVPISDRCATHAANGQCLTCYKGYDLTNGTCVISPANTASPSDLGCATWDWNNQVCLTCSNKWVFNANKKCVAVSDQCATNAANGDCLTCFKGYDLVNGTCVFSASNNAKPSDLGCATWDWNNQVCLTCSKNWVFNSNKVCIPVNDHCKTHADNGDCTTCYKGFDLQNGQCLYSAANTAAPSDIGCATWDWNNQVCLKCSEGWVFNADKKCVAVSDQCKTHAANGDCTACFQGYDLSNGTCVFSASNNAKPSDLGCGTWDWNNQVCLACSNKWVFNANKKCVPVSDQCKTNAANGDCLTCFKGYDLVNGQCILSLSNNATPSDSGCGLWDWNNQVCLQCSKGWIFNINKVCVVTSDLCQSIDSVTGACTSCYEGYDLTNGSCVYSSFNNARPYDLGCSTWDWKKQVCLKCSHRWFFNSQNKCVPVDDNCNAYAADGSCSTCYAGYAVSNGVCLSVNPLCKTLNADGSCASCYPQNILHQGNCVPISKLANILLYYAECCP
jgi:hypothetical protein